MEDCSICDNNLMFQHVIAQWQSNILILCWTFGGFGFSSNLRLGSRTSFVPHYRVKEEEKSLKSWHKPLALLVSNFIFWTICSTFYFFFKIHIFIVFAYILLFSDSKVLNCYWCQATNNGRECPIPLALTHLKPPTTPTYPSTCNLLYG